MIHEAHTLLGVAVIMTGWDGGVEEYGALVALGAEPVVHHEGNGYALDWRYHADVHVPRSESFVLTGLVG